MGGTDGVLVGDTVGLVDDHTIVRVVFVIYLFDVAVFV